MGHPLFVFLPMKKVEDRLLFEAILLLMMILFLACIPGANALISAFMALILIGGLSVMYHEIRMS